MKTITFCIIPLVMLTTCNSKNTYIIHGSFTEKPTTAWIYLTNYDFDHGYQIDSAQIKNGRFIFEGIINRPEVFEIRYDHHVNTFDLPIFLEPGEFNVNIDPNQLELGSTIKGGRFNEEYERLLAFKRKNFSLINLDENDPENLLANYELGIRQRKEYDDHCKNYIEKNPASPISIYLLARSFTMLPLEEQGDRIAHFSAEVHHMSLYKKFKQDYENQLNLIDRTPAIMLDETDTSSFEIDFSQATILHTLIEHNKGKAMYIDIWGTWCGPCIASFPRMRELTEEIGPDKIQFVYLCSKSLENEWKEMILKEQLIGQHYLLGDGQLKRLQSQLGRSSLGYPTYLLINKEGKVCKNAPRPHSQNIERLLKSLI